MKTDRPILTPREAAKDLIRVYVLRGDSLDSLADGMLGFSGDDYSAHIGGYLWWREDLHDPNGRPIHLKRYQIGVEHVQGEKVMQVFSLAELYKEIQAEKVTGRREQLSLF